MTKKAKHIAQMLWQIHYRSCWSDLGTHLLKAIVNKKMEINYIGRDGFNFTQSYLVINEIAP